MNRWHDVAVVVLAALLMACSQAPATIELHGNQYFGKHDQAKQPLVQKAQAVAVRGKHVVQPGDTLYRIAVTYQLDPTDVMRLNDLQPPYTLHVGQEVALSVPGGKRLLPLAEKAPVVTRKASPFPPQQLARAKASVPTPTVSPKRMVVKKPIHLPAKARRSKVQFVWPVKGPVISRFGAKKGGQHNDGINISVREGTVVKAAEDGVVVYAGNELKGYGNLVLIKHHKGWLTTYAHARELKVSRGDIVKRGGIIGYAGSTGRVDKPQLHFAIRKGKKAVNPEQLL